MPLAPPYLVTGAVRTPLPFGLFSTFTFRPQDRWEQGVAWEMGTCDPADGIAAIGCTLPTQEVQTVTRGTGVTAFTLTTGGQTTTSLASTATAAQVQAALVALTSIGAGGVTVTGPTGGPYAVKWTAAGDRQAMTSTGTGGTMAVVTTTQGVANTQGLPKNLATNLATNGAATPFTVYGHFECSPMGWTFASAQAQADVHLLTREEARVEQALWTGDLGNTPKLRGATVVGSAATNAPTIGVGLLEDFIATEYGSLGLIHMTRAAALSLTKGGVLVPNGGRLTTRLGTPVAAGAGYDGSGPTGQVATDTTTWMYVTPPVFGYRTEEFTSSNRPGDLLDRASNDLYAVAERSYLIGFDPCGVGATQITLS